MRLRLFSLLLTILFASVSFAQTPEIDSSRWSTSGGVALTQTQSSTQGSPFRLTWGFAQEGTTIPTFGAGAQAASNLIARLDTIYGVVGGGSDLTTRSWFTHFDSTFNRWASISGLSYQYEANDDGATFSSSNGTASRGILGTRADVRISGRNIDGNSNILAFNFFPTVGDMVIDTNDNFFESTGNNSRGLRNVLSHEHGHGIGMPHVVSNNSRILMEPFIDSSFDGPQYHDILLAQRAYGDANEKSFAGLGNDISSRATDLGVIASGANASVGNSARTFGVLNTSVPFTANDFVSIDDTSDTDFWRFTVNQSGTINVLLESLGFTYQTQPADSNGNGTGTLVNFDSKARSDLSLALFDTNGTSQLTSVNLTGLGGNESLTGFSLAAAGTYFLRVTGLNNSDASTVDAQFYGLNVSFTGTAVPEPSTAGLCLVGMMSLGMKRRRRAA